MKVTLIPGFLQNALGAQRPFAELSRAELSLCLDLLARIVHSNDKVDILRPDETPFPMADIQAFRQTQYQTLSPYLLDAYHQQLELQYQLDERSHQFVAVDYVNDAPHIIGTARVTPAPYELAQLSPQLAEAASHYQAYWELGRLVVDALYSSGFVGEKLLMGSARWLCHSTDIPGFMLICKQRRRRYFEYYGLTAHQTADGQPALFTLPARLNQTYHLMTGTFATLIEAICATVYYHPEEMAKRHRWTDRP